MTALPPDVVADLSKLVAELEQRLESSFAAHDAAIAQQAEAAQENARLQAELAIARDRQNASAEILRTIANTSGDADASLQQIAETTARLFDAASVTIRIADGNRWGRTIRFGDGSERIGREIPAAQLEIGARNLPSAVFRHNAQIHVPDLTNLGPEMADWPGLVTSRAAGLLTVAGTPLRREGQPIGILIVYRNRLAPFTDEELALQQAFADQAAIAIENARLFNETREALERQTATADILKVIASSPSDVQPVFEAIVNSAAELFAPHTVTISPLRDGKLHWGAIAARGPTFDHETAKSVYPIPFDPVRSPSARAILERCIVEIPDTESPDTPEYTRRVAAAGGFRNATFVPLLHQGVGIGTIILTHHQPGVRLTESQLALVQTFADQAVIAIENARLFNETQEALARQTATADILRVISQSPTDVQPVFDTIVATAVRLLGCDQSFVFRCDGGSFWSSARAGPEGPLPIAVQEKIPVDPAANFPSRAIVERKTLHLPDWSAIDLPDFERRIHERLGYNSTLYLPMLREQECIGLLGLARKQVGPFSENEIALAESFRDQALIAIENARLFNETQEALERQTATADILKVIASSPSDVQPVFEAIAERSNRLIEGLSTAVYSLIDDALHLMAFTRGNPVADAALQASFPRPLTSATWGDRIRNGEIVEIPDFESSVEAAERPDLREVARLRGFRSLLFVPLLRDLGTIGMISVTRNEPGRFTPHHVQLLQTFADQAVIAIENVRLFNETQEALERQTATADILKVIASSPSDVQPVFEAIATSANRLLGGFSAAVFRFLDGTVHLAALTPVSPAADAALKADFPKSTDQFEPFELAQQARPFPIPDTEQIPFAPIKEIARVHGFRSMLFVPLMNGDDPIGIISVTRVQPGSFAGHHVQLLQTFADQAVIAIENVRLFDEVQAKTRDLTEALTYQTGSGNILKVIASSPTEVGPVLKAIVDNACEVCDAYDAAVLLKDGDDLRFNAHHGPIPIDVEKWPINRRWTAGRAVLDKAPVHLHDLLDEANADFSDGRELSRRMGHRSILSVPLLRDNEAIGAIVLRRTEVHPFSDKQIELLQTFADQAVIAIGNVRLFEEVQAKTRDLSASLDELRTAQDRLVQTEKLASLGQLTAGIAHEIKNPLNFVNNFAALSAELTDELNEILKPAPLDPKVREEVDELTGLLKDNLEKVVQHGKRADSIVKNMLLHSREGSGDHRPADINALVDESLNLAYHGARAERPDFNATLQRDFDSGAGTAEVFPQEITRVFLNLVSNGFYAVTRRRIEAGDAAFDPVISASTRDLGDSVEIRIRDNGTGIPPEVRDKMFNPFFTTKPAGEGTGLGLSMSHDIIVKQHGGSIEVETEPGQFTEFRIVLPRKSATSNKNRGQT